MELIEENKTEKQLEVERQKKWMIKTVIIIALTLLLLIPSGMVSSLIRERAERQEQVIQKVSDSWAENQIITGPYLRFQLKDKDVDGNNIQYESFAYPEKLEIKTKIKTEERPLGIFKIPVYTAVVQIKGHFPPLNKYNENASPDKMLSNKAEVHLRVSDLKGLMENCVINWNGQIISLNPDKNKVNEMSTWADVSNAFTEAIPFEISFPIRGTESILFTPLAEQTYVSMESNWNSPGYIGMFLPATPENTKDGFKASWSIPKSAVPFHPSQYVNEQMGEKYSFGVKMVQPVNHYSSAERSVKYSLLIIALTFLGFFMIESRRGQQIHPLHYTLVGLALVLFYSLLVSISEFSSFGLAYLVSAALTTLLISLFTRSVLKESKPSMGVAVILSGLYTFVYFIVLQEDYALLFGNIGLFLILAIVMYFSRNMQWSKS